MHGDAQLSEIASSIHRFGFTNPVLVAPEGALIAGDALADFRLHSKSITVEI
jgi:hypothetical protein